MTYLKKKENHSAVDKICSVIFIIGGLLLALMILGIIGCTDAFCELTPKEKDEMQKAAELAMKQTYNELGIYEMLRQDSIRIAGLFELTNKDKIRFAEHNDRLKRCHELLEIVRYKIWIEDKWYRKYMTQSWRLKQYRKHLIKNEGTDDRP